MDKELIYKSHPSFLGTEAPEAIKKRVMHELNIYNKTLQSTYLGMQNLLKNHQLAHLVFFQRKCGKDLMDGVISHYLELGRKSCLNQFSKLFLYMS
jgi:hypothetical protein